MSRKTGQLKKFIADKGFGFIKTDSEDMFFHVNDSKDLDVNLLDQGAEVSYEEMTDKRGQLKACNVKMEEN